MLLYLTAGLITSFIGALPIGTSNLFVVNTTMKNGLRLSLQVIFGAAIGEGIMSFFALHCTRIVSNLFIENAAIQVAFAVIMIAVGLVLIIKKPKIKTTTEGKKGVSFFSQGFILSTINPFVLVYWILAYGYFHSHMLIRLDLSQPIVFILLFFFGVMMGKFLALLLYARFSKWMTKHIRNIQPHMQRGIGIILILVGLFQIFRFVLPAIQL